LLAQCRLARGGEVVGASSSAANGWPSCHSGGAITTLGWIMVFVLFTGGFITVGGEWFTMWQSKTWNGLQPALPNFLIALVGQFVAHLPNTDHHDAATSVLHSRSPTAGRSALVGTGSAP
jgi:hypothetical protein